MNPLTDKQKKAVQSWDTQVATRFRLVENSYRFAETIAVESMVTERFEKDSKKNDIASLPQDNFAPLVQWITLSPQSPADPNPYDVIAAELIRAVAKRGSVAISKGKWRGIADTMARYLKDLEIHYRERNRNLASLARERVNDLERQLKTLGPQLFQTQ